MYKSKKIEALKSEFEAAQTAEYASVEEAKAAMAALFAKVAETTKRTASGEPRKPMSEEAKAKLKAHWTPEKRAAHSANMVGKHHHTPEQRAKLSESLRKGNAERKAKQDEMIARIVELEAALAEKKTTKKS